MSACIICGGIYGNSAFRGLVKCTVCGFVSANLFLTQAELQQLYGERYFQGEEYRDYIADREVIEKHFRLRLAKLMRYVPDAESKNLLEIGCAYGFFLLVARHSFARVEGLDISPAAISYARDRLHMPVCELDFLDYEPTTPIHAVCLWDTVEHLADPSAYIAKAARILSPGGVIAITTGDIESVVARTRGSRWRQIHPPTHLHYFSKRTLTDLLERNGFRVVYTGWDGQYRSLDTIAYVILMIKHRHPRLYGTLKKSGLLSFAVYLNLYDIMYVIAEKTRPTRQSRELNV
jgi:SAM-dependent methyltransferase